MHPLRAPAQSVEPVHTVQGHVTRGAAHTSMDNVTRDPRVDAAFMRLALGLARQGTPAPNPHVGAVVVQRGEVVGVGHHERAGAAHAEALAIVRAGKRARDATLYVTLEPCNHHGRTPPCVDAILQSGIRRVVIGCADPNPHVEGGGAEALRRAGLEVSGGDWVAQAEDLIATWRSGLGPPKPR